MGFKMNNQEVGGKDVISELEEVKQIFMHPTGIE